MVWGEKMACAWRNTPVVTIAALLIALALTIGCAGSGDRQSSDAPNPDDSANATLVALRVENERLATQVAVPPVPSPDARVPSASGLANARAERGPGELRILTRKELSNQEECHKLGASDSVQDKSASLKVNVPGVTATM